MSASPTVTIDDQSPPGAWARAIADTPHLAAQAQECGSCGYTAAPDCETCAPGTLLPFITNEQWWAQRWIEKATPGELAAMRELLTQDERN